MPEEIRKWSVPEAQAWAPVIRELIKHENDLVNQRLGWLIQIQGLLFAALGIAWKDAPKQLTILFSILGISTALSLWTTIAFYSPAVRGLVGFWDDHRPDSIGKGPHVIGRWLPSKSPWKYLRPWRALPLIFVGAWIGVFILSWCCKK